MRRNRTRPIVIAMAALLLSGCQWVGLWDEDEPPQAAEPAAQETTAAPVAADEASTPAPAVDPAAPKSVAFEYTGERSPDILQLVAPDGTGIDPVAVDRGTEYVVDDGFWPDIRVGVTGGSSSKVQTGIGIGFPLFGSEDDLRPAATRTVARFDLPDPQDYRKNWTHYRVVMIFDAGTDKEQRLEAIAPHP